jgi:hypothetical protein
MEYNNFNKLKMANKNFLYKKLSILYETKDNGEMLNLNNYYNVLSNKYFDYNPFLELHKIHNSQHIDKGVMNSYIQIIENIDFLQDLLDFFIDNDYLIQQIENMREEIDELKKEVYKVNIKK